MLKIIKENGHDNEHDMILKMDIEHREWESIIDLEEDALNKINILK